MQPKVDREPNVWTEWSVRYCWSNTSYKRIILLINEFNGTDIRYKLFHWSLATQFDHGLLSVQCSKADIMSHDNNPILTESRYHYKQASNEGDLLDNKSNYFPSWSDQTRIFRGQSKIWKVIEKNFGLTFQPAVHSSTLLPKCRTACTRAVLKKDLFS